VELILNSIDFAENRHLDGYSSGGELYFAVDDGFFPAEHWYDCAYTDLKIWLPRLISFGSNHTDSCELSFMDGPYTIRLHRREDGAVSGSFYRAQKLIGSEQNVDMRRLLKSALSACRKYDRFLYENGKINAFREEIKILMKLLDT
jgi:hypothetical protein